MAVENAPEKYKGFYGAFPQLGNPMGALLASGVFSLLSLGGEEFLHSWGWRIPFLVAAVLIAVGFWVRYRVEETPVFEHELERREEQHIVKTELPLKTALRDNWRTILIAMGLIPISTGGYYMVTTFATAYATGEPINLNETLILNVLAVAAFVELISTLFIGVAADRWGRKKVMGISLVVTAILVIPMFLTIGNGPEWMLFFFFALVRVVMNGTWAPLAAIMAQMFDPESRQTSLSIGYSTGNAIWAGLSPLVSTGLFIATGSIWSVIALFAGLTVLSLVCLVIAPQRKDFVFESNPVGGSVAPTGGAPA
jgi:MFS family permease